MSDSFETMSIRQMTVMDGRKPLRVVELYFNNCKRASIEEQRNGEFKFRFYPTGAFHMEEAKVWLQGCMELFVLAEGLQDGKK